MMKHIIFISALVLASAVTGGAMADDSKKSKTEISKTVNPKTKIPKTVNPKSANALTACGGTQVTDATSPTLTNLLLNHTICQSSPEVAQEEHHSGNVLKDYKKGPSDPADPTSQIGTWAVSGTGTGTEVAYTYGSNVYHYNVYLNAGTLGTNGSTYDFCTASTTTLITTGTLRTSFGSTSSNSPVCP